jgi:hypothetical protein
MLTNLGVLVTTMSRVLEEPMGLQLFKKFFVFHASWFMTVH